MDNGECLSFWFYCTFPSDQSDITGISHEPWHFRYVGKEAAKRFMIINGL